jgi:hypothetical protein
MKRISLTLMGYNSDPQVDRLKVEGESFFGCFTLFSSSRRISGLCADRLNTCVVISQSFEKNE